MQITFSTHEPLKTHLNHSTWVWSPVQDPAEVSVHIYRLNSRGPDLPTSIKATLQRHEPVISLYKGLHEPGSDLEPKANHLFRLPRVLTCFPLLITFCFLSHKWWLPIIPICLAGGLLLTSQVSWAPFRQDLPSIHSPDGQGCLPWILIALETFPISASVPTHCKDFTSCLPSLAAGCSLESSPSL